MPVSGWPAVDIGATGVLGVAFETTAGTYVAPSKFFPINSESLMIVQDNIKRRPLRGVNDIIGIVAGRSSVKGDITFELNEDVLIYFLDCMRLNGVKTGTTPNWVYTWTPFHGAIPNKTMSITVVRDGIVFGYVGCLVDSLSIDAADNGIVTCKASILGLDEAVQSAPTPSYNTNVPYGPGTYNVQIPTGTQVFDMDKFTFEVNDAAVVQWRLQTSKAASFINYGERTVSYKTERDFTSRTEYDTYFRAATTESGLTVLLSKGTNNSVQITLPKPQPDDFNVGQLSGQGTLIRSAVTYDAVYDLTTSESYGIVVKTQETITP
jgi:hypothetical protein